jgi:hypothetical protein
MSQQIDKSVKIGKPGNIIVWAFGGALIWAIASVIYGAFTGNLVYEVVDGLICGATLGTVEERIPSPPSASEPDMRLSTSSGSSVHKPLS